METFEQWYKEFCEAEGFVNYKHVEKAYKFGKGNLKWTKELPIKEGWYWIKNKYGLTVVHVINGSIYDDSMNENILVKDYRCDEWYGPIEPPEYP